MPRPSAAEALFPHLPHRDEAQSKRTEAQSFADAMYPQLSHRQRAWDARRERERQSLLEGLRALNARLDARLQARR